MPITHTAGLGTGLNMKLKAVLDSKDDVISEAWQKRLNAFVRVVSQSGFTNPSCGSASQQASYGIGGTDMLISNVSVEPLDESASKPCAPCEEQNNATNMVAAAKYIQSLPPEQRQNIERAAKESGLDDLIIQIDDSTAAKNCHKYKGEDSTFAMIDGASKMSTTFEITLAAVSFEMSLKYEARASIGGVRHVVTNTGFTGKTYGAKSLSVSGSCQGRCEDEKVTGTSVLQIFFEMKAGANVTLPADLIKALPDLSGNGTLATDWSFLFPFVHSVGE